MPLSGEKSIGEIAGRIIDKYYISGVDTFIGSSLGGIVALEIHRRVNLRHIVLIGSAISREEINSFLIALAPLAKITPMRLIQQLSGKNFDELSAMFAKVDAEFVRAMCLAVTRWSGYNGSMLDVARIHGERDAVIKCPIDAYVIAGGGHLIAMTNAAECIEIINKIGC